MSGFVPGRDTLLRQDMKRANSLDLEPTVDQERSAEFETHQRSQSAGRRASAAAGRAPRGNLIGAMAEHASLRRAAKEVSELISHFFLGLGAVAKSTLKAPASNVICLVANERLPQQ